MAKAPNISSILPEMVRQAAAQLPTEDALDGIAEGLRTMRPMRVRDPLGPGTVNIIALQQETALEVASLLEKGAKYIRILKARTDQTSAPG